MKRFFKATCAALVAACISVSFFGCASDEAQAEEWNGNPSVVSLNKETAHTHGLISYNSVEEAVAADAENSGNYLSLNGSWSFKLVTSAADVPEDFMSDEFDTSSWDSINVPATGRRRASLCRPIIWTAMRGTPRFIPRPTSVTTTK